MLTYPVSDPAIAAQVRQARDYFCAMSAWRPTPKTQAKIVALPRPGRSVSAPQRKAGAA